MTKERTAIGLEIEEGLKEVLAHVKGETTLESRIVPPDAKRIRRVRKGLAKSREAFEALYGIPARTVQEWEQGRRRPDLTASAYLAVIEQDPEAVAAMYAKARERED